MSSIRLRLLLAGVLVGALAGSAALVKGLANLDAKETGLLAAKLERLDALLHDAVARRTSPGASLCWRGTAGSATCRPSAGATPRPKKR